MNQMLDQLKEALNRPIGWISDSSTSKTPVGKLVSVRATLNGLRISLDSGRVVNWRIPFSTSRQLVSLLEKEKSYG